MKEKTTERFKDINKNATVGSDRVRIFKIDLPAPTKSTSGKKSIKSSIRSSAKKRKCSGCSRKRKRA